MTKSYKLQQVEKYANLLMEVIMEYEYGVYGWKFKYDGARRRIGQCDYYKKTISMSKHWTETLPFSEIDDTIRHEIAHALTPEDGGHGKIWKKMAKKLGARPERIAPLEINEYRPKSKYYLAIKHRSGDIEVLHNQTGFNRMLKDLEDRYLRKRKKETDGRLYMIRTKDFEEGNISPEYLLR